MKIEFKATLYIDDDEKFSLKDLEDFLQDRIDTPCIDIKKIEIINQE